MAVTAVIIPKGEAATDQTLYAAAATTLSGSLGPFPVDFWSSAEITVVVTTCSGTFDVFLRKRLADESTYENFATFPQWTTAVFTTTGTYTLSFVNGGNSIVQTTSQGVAANTVNTVQFGGYWQIDYKIGGTGGTTTFGVYGNFRS